MQVFLQKGLCWHGITIKHMQKNPRSRSKQLIHMKKCQQSGFVAASPIAPYRNQRSCRKFIFTNCVTSWKFLIQNQWLKPLNEGKQQKQHNKKQKKEHNGVSLSDLQTTVLSCQTGGWHPAACMWSVCITTLHHLCSPSRNVLGVSCMLSDLIASNVALCFTQCSWWGQLETHPGRTEPQTERPPAGCSRWAGYKGWWENQQHPLFPSCLSSYSSWLKTKPLRSDGRKQIYIDVKTGWN